jgi:DHA3 family tetracycline resistance protein-like MFS transporter
MKMKFFKKDELKLLWPFYLDALVISIFFIFPAFYIIYLKDLGLSLFQIGLLLSVTSLSSLLFEVPTGAIADIYGRKFSTILGVFLSGVAMICIYFATEFYSLLILFFLWGAVGTFISGAREAWIVDLVKTNGKENLVKEFFVKRHSFGGAACLLSGIIGAIIVAKLGLGVIWIISGASLVLTSIAFLFGQEHFKREDVKIRGGFRKVLFQSKKSVKFCWNHRILFNFLLMILIISFMIGFAGDITWYPLLQENGLKDYWFGIFFSGTFILSIFIPYLVKPLAKKAGSYVKYLMWVIAAMFFILFSVIFVNSLIAAIIAAFLFFSMWDFFHPARNIIFQKFTPSPMRATIGSLESMIYSIGTLIALPVAGFIADKIGVQKTLFVGSFLLIPCLFILWKIREGERG